MKLRDFFLSPDIIAEGDYRFFTGFGFYAVKIRRIRGKIVTEISPPSPAVSAVSRDRVSPSTSVSDLDAARGVAEKLEATFLAEMLKSAGFGSQENSFSGSSGEDQFASFHRQAIAEKMVVAGGIGLTEHILRHMTEVQNDV